MKNILNKKKIREFGFFMVFGFPFFVGFLTPLIFGHPFKTWTLLIGILFLIITLIKPSLLYFPLKVWTSLSNVLGWINSRIILSIIYIFILIPLSILMKIFKYDPLLTKRKITDSYRIFIKNNNIDLKKVF
tara:strand:+ start:81 stop:473 length:393 start_codon:yes stop_codon:yes gene_type:complete